jgi:hypothetical protein
MRLLQPRCLSVRPLALEVVSLDRTSSVSKERRAFISGLERPRLQSCLTLKIKALRSFETSATARSTTQRYIPGDLEGQINTVSRSETLQLAFLHTPIFCYQECAFYLTSERLAHSFHARHSYHPVPRIPDYLNTQTSYSHSFNTHYKITLSLGLRRSGGNKPLVKGEGNWATSVK